MKVTIEKVDKLVERADVSYEVAKEALESAGGDLLDAVILLEREGKLGPNAGQKKVTTYTTDGKMSSVIGQAYGAPGTLQTRVEPNFTPGGQPDGQPGGYANYQQPDGQPGGYANYQQPGGQPGGRSRHQYKDESAQVEENAKKFFSWLGRLIRGGCVNYFEVWRRGERVLYFPVILFLFCLIHWVFWIFLAFLLIGLLCGCRYRFAGPHLGRDSVNETMDKAADIAEDIKNDIGNAEEKAGEKAEGKAEEKAGE